MSKEKQERIARMLGIAFDAGDGHIRVSQGDNFSVYLGSEDTHDEIRELCMRVNDALSREGRTLRELTREEFLDLIDRVGNG